MDDIITALTSARDADQELMDKIWSNADGRFLSRDEDADVSYLEGKIQGYDEAIMLLEGKGSK
jgi:hypothetical protein